MNKLEYSESMIHLGFVSYFDADKNEIFYNEEFNIEASIYFFNTTIIVDGIRTDSLYYSDHSYILKRLKNIIRNKKINKLLR